MCAAPPPAELRRRFQQLLNVAIAEGRVPDSDAGFGPRTLAAITQVAREHPEATADQIASAYDAFRREHH